MNALLLVLALAAPPELITFDAPTFPRGPHAPPLAEIEGALVAHSEAQLIEALTPDRVLVWRHGASFPAGVWPAFVRFLENGGSFLHLGGEPFTLVTNRRAGEYVGTQPRTTSLLKELRLNQAYRIPVGGDQLSNATNAADSRTLADDALAFVLEPRFSDTVDFAREDGAPGSRDAVLHPLSFIHRQGADPRFPSATAAFAIDRLLGRFAGGRWVFYLLSTPPTGKELKRLIAEARRPATDFRADPTYGCYHEGERPAITVRCHRPASSDVVTWNIEGEVTDPSGNTMPIPPIALEVGRHGSRQLPLPGLSTPGLYRVSLTRDRGDQTSTGFWIMDEELFRSGDEITFDRYTMRRNGVPEPVIGTTVMSKTVHRKFLFEPNAAVWDDTFSELAAIDVNFVRTGIWSAYRKISLDPGVIDEAFLRALEAYYLSARKHGIPILFTFFSFVPETFGGSSPYFDPRALDAQRAYVHEIASRFKNTREMLFDLINEPSFASPDKLWFCRPHGDKWELAAFRGWLKQRYSPLPDGSDWEDSVRARWKLRPDEPIGLPTDDDFADRQVFEDHRPYRAKEWVLFAQYAFRDWMKEMTAAIREAGSTTSITVGQDEGGLIERPSPLFHDDLVDYTSVHTWWFNDHLSWDAVFAKAPDRPLLVSETGIMQREMLSGISIRTPEGSAALLERKVAHSFLGGAFGTVEWCYDVNPYMASDNEVAIGLRRTDGSFKPELDILARYARFLARNRAHFDSPKDPEVVLLMPSSDHWGPRAMQLAGSQRDLAVLGPAVQVVHEHRTAEHLRSPKLIVLPACRGISSRAWADVMAAVEKGSTLHASGWFETDDAGIPTWRLHVGLRALANREALAGGEDEIDYVAFARDVTESWFAADLGEDGPLRITPRGSGSIRHHALPLEWSTDRGPLRRALKQSLDASGVDQPLAALHPAIRSTTRRIRFKNADLWISVNETSAMIELGHPALAKGQRFAIQPGRAVMILADREGRILDQLAEGDRPEGG